MVIPTPKDRLDLQKFLDWLLQQEKSLEINEKEKAAKSILISEAKKVWQKLDNHFLSQDRLIDIPDACCGENNNFMYVWSDDEHYLECEIFGETRTAEFFYRNKNNGELWGEDVAIESNFSLEIIEKVSLFAS